MGFNPSFKCLTGLATLKSCDTMKRSVCGWQYIPSPTGVEHSGKGIHGYALCKALPMNCALWYPVRQQYKQMKANT